MPSDCGCYEPGCACEERDALRDEVAALERAMWAANEARKTWEENYYKEEDRSTKAERELAEARALLARVTAAIDPVRIDDDNDERQTSELWAALDAVRAFLDPRRAEESILEDKPHKNLGNVRPGKSARDEAPGGD